MRSRRATASPTAAAAVCAAARLAWPSCLADAGARLAFACADASVAVTERSEARTDRWAFLTADRRLRRALDSSELTPCSAAAVAAVGEILTVVLAMSVVATTYDAIVRFLRDPWPLDRTETAMAAAVVREAGFGIAGPKIRQAHLFGALIAIAAMKGLALPGMRRALHSAHVAEQRVGEQRKRIYGATVEQLKSERQP